jgi:16S rRNA (cytidine1402-2'-O)-methyltransferase
MIQPILYIVASPIGNLADITLRALEILKSADLVVAEDTRVTQKLLRHYSIKKPMQSVRERSSASRIDSLINEINAGRWLKVAYLSDAGTPGISDPGGRLVAAARSANITIETVPGASALTALLQVAGVPLGDGFLFLGYLPKKKGRQTLFKKLQSQRWPVVIFERGNRVGKTLGQFEKIYGRDTLVIIGREMTKKFEEIKVFKLADLADTVLNIKGEFTILIKPSSQVASNK